jgi:hypothetical protein
MLFYAHITREDVEDAVRFLVETHGLQARQEAERLAEVGRRLGSRRNSALFRRAAQVLQQPAPAPASAQALQQSAPAPASAQALQQSAPAPASAQALQQSALAPASAQALQQSALAPASAQALQQPAPAPAITNLAPARGSWLDSLREFARARIPDDG